MFLQCAHLLLEIVVELHFLFEEVVLGGDGSLELGAQTFVFTLDAAQTALEFEELLVVLLPLNS